MWRLDRASGEERQVGVLDAGVVRDMYTIIGDDGSRDLKMHMPATPPPLTQLQ
jgi:hypothetical protein